jgi:uncharacterized protein YndB with AHSA1/START domain
MSSPTSFDASDREIVISRDFHAPRELVWEAWTDPKHVVQWWGPRGFTTTIKEMDVRVGGSWAHTMQGPDGTNYPNKSVFREVVKPERIVFSHGGGSEDGRGATFVSTWSFEALDPKKTRVTIRMVFPSKEDRDRVVKDYGAIEGGKQTLTRLGEHVDEQLCPSFVISREFDAPRDLVWKVWTEPEHFKHWFGPKGFTMPTMKMDFRPGGMLHYALAGPNGATLWGKAIYRDIVPPKRILWVNSFSDAQGGTVRHPFSKDPWPLQMLTDISFEEKNAKTLVSVKWVPLDASDEERATFNAGRPNMNQGWGGTFEQLTGYLAEVGKPR